MSEDKNKPEEDILPIVEVKHIFPSLSRWPGGAADELLKAEFLNAYQATFHTLTREEHEKVLRSAHKYLYFHDAQHASAGGAESGASPPNDAAIDTADRPAPPTPPPFGETLVGLFCKRDIREAVLGDLDEKFAELTERRGVNFAKAWYWSQAARSALFFAVRWGRRLLALEAILKRIL